MCIRDRSRHGSMRRLLQDPAGSCTQARVNAPLAFQDPARLGALADPRLHRPPPRSSRSVASQ
eukprot:2867693-Pyramimonas_sp.AAC.1